MAANIQSEDERERRIIFVGEYFINNPGVSIRKACEDISNNYFKISIATIHDYLQRYKKMFEQNRLLIEEHINNNKEKTILDEDVKIRVLNNTKLYLSGLSVLDISLKTDNDYWTIYRDLTVRLSKIDQNLYNKVSELMNENRLENLKKK